MYWFYGFIQYQLLYFKKNIFNKVQNLREAKSKITQKFEKASLKKQQYL